MVAIKVAKGDLNKKTVKFFRDVFLKAEDEVNKASGTVSTNVDSLPASSLAELLPLWSSWSPYGSCDIHTAARNEEVGGMPHFNIPLASRGWTRDRVLDIDAVSFS